MTLGGGAEVCLPAAHIQASMKHIWGLLKWCWSYSWWWRKQRALYKTS